MNRLRSFRHIEQMTQKDLGEILGVSPQMVSAVEKGSRDLSFDITPIGYTTDRFRVPDMSEPLHRQRASTRAASTYRAKELLRLAGELVRDLRRRVSGVPEVVIERLGTPQTLDDVEDVAREVRSLLGVEEQGPIRDLTSAVERSGVVLIPIVALQGVDGLSSWVEGQPVVGLAPSVSGDRFRFSLAHEIAHLTIHRRKGEVTEDQANRFAGALIFPEEEFCEAVSSRTTVKGFVSLKATWGMSVGAQVYRAHELGLVDDRRYRSLQIQMSRWRKTEPGSFDPAFGRLLPRLVETQGGVEAVSSGLGLSDRHVRELVNWSHLRAVGRESVSP